MNGDSTTPMWYYAKAGAVDGQQVGPVSWNQLQSLAHTGALAANDLVWNPQFPSWVTAAEVPGLLAPPLPKTPEPSSEAAPPPLGPTTPVRPGAIQPSGPRPGAIQPTAAGRTSGRPGVGYDPFFDDDGGDDFGDQRPWLKWGLIAGAVVVIAVIVGVYFGVIRGGTTEPTTTLAPTTTTEMTTTTTEPPVTQSVWAELAPVGDIPPARAEHAVAYDSGNASVVLFGGWDKDGITFNDTWEFDSTLDTWVQVPPGETLPAARAQHQMVYDPTTRQVILFGGVLKEYGPQLNDTWAYDPATQIWTELKPEGSVPSLRSSFAMAYDSDNERVILFGGWSNDTSAHLNDTWAYDPATNTWNNLEPVGDVPSMRGSHSMAYDPVQKKIVLFGGMDADAYLNDTWVYDFATNTWTGITPVADVPTMRSGHRMTYDPTSGTIVLFGGWDGTAYFDDTWSFDVATSTWTDLSPVGNVPMARDSHSFIYDAATQELVLFGGFVGAADVGNDTWSFGMGGEISTIEVLPPLDPSMDEEMFEEPTTTLPSENL